MQPPTRRRLLPGALALWILLLALVGFRFAGKAGDDVYITYRYVQNLAEGNGLVFNPGERVFGVTDPGTALLIAGVHGVTRLPIPWAGTLATALALLAIATVLLLEGLRRDRAPEAFAAGTLLLISPYVWYGQGAGPLFVLALLLGAAGQGRGARAGLLAGLAFWCRPDAAVGAGWLGLLLWRDRRRFPSASIAYAMTAALVALAGCLAAWAWFGTVIPNTLEAKRQFAALDPSARTGARVFWGSAIDLFRYFAGPFSWAVPLLGLVGQIPLFGADGQRSRAGRLLVLHAGSLALAYTVLEVPFFIWYTLPAAVACLYGAAYAGGWAVRRLLALGTPAARWTAMAAATFLLLSVLSWGAGSLRWWREGGKGDWQLAAYTRAGTWLREHTGPKADIAAEEVGILAFTSQRPVLDLIGLVSPESMPYAAQGDMAGAFLARPTRFVVFHTFTPRGGTRPIVSKAWFPRAYRQVARFDFPDLGGSIFLYRRRPGAQIPPPRPPRLSPRLGPRRAGLGFPGDGCVLGEELRQAGLEGDAEGVRHAVDVVEPGGEQGDVQDAQIVEARCPQRLGVALPHRRGGHGELVGEVEHGALARRQLGLGIIDLELVGQGVLTGHRSEELRVADRSVEAPVGGRDHRIDHLPFAAGERGGAADQMQAAGEDGPQGHGIEAVGLGDAAHVVLPLAPVLRGDVRRELLIDGSQLGGELRVLEADGLDPRHEASPFSTVESLLTFKVTGASGDGTPAR